VTELWDGPKRRRQRIELEVEVLVVTNGAVLPGRTLDISESGVAVITPVELHEGAEVELQIKLPSGTQSVCAIVRHRNVYRHGFEFTQPLVGIFRNDAATGDLYLEQGNRELQK
jgi:PilZ domain-containing protein